MNYKNFYVVATPIGNLKDISQRALDVLNEVDLILAEDTRRSGKLLQYFVINTRLKSLHDHNEERSLDTVLSMLENKSIALISDAGTPLVSDPGYKLVKFLRENGVRIIPIPGPSALLAALSASGLPTDSFVFYGFLPSADKARLDKLRSVASEDKTMVFFESPKRVIKTVAVMLECFGGDRLCCLAREISKLNEQIVRANLKDMYAKLDSGEVTAKGEFVILLAGTDKVQNVSDQEVSELLRVLVEECTHKQAVKLASKITGVARNHIYSLSLKQVNK